VRRAGRGKVMTAFVKLGRYFCPTDIQMISRLLSHEELFKGPLSLYWNHFSLLAKRGGVIAVVKKTMTITAA
jgi:hypothetical protein